MRNHSITKIALVVPLVNMTGEYVDDSISRREDLMENKSSLHNEDTFHLVV